MEKQPEKTVATPMNVIDFLESKHVNVIRLLDLELTEGDQVDRHGFRALNHNAIRQNQTSETNPQVQNYLSRFLVAIRC